jgi:putative oxidoreductase
MLDSIIPLNVDIGLLILRVALSIVFIAHGVPRLYKDGKFHGPTKLIAFLKKANFPLPEVSAWAIALIETVGVVMLLLGLQTRILAVVLILDMLIAITQGHIRLAKSNFSGGETIGWEFEFLLLAGAATLFMTGPGAFSLDRMIGG